MSSGLISRLGRRLRRLNGTVLRCLVRLLRLLVSIYVRVRRCILKVSCRFVSGKRMVLSVILLRLLLICRVPCSCWVVVRVVMKVVRCASCVWFRSVSCSRFRVRSVRFRSRFS